MRTLRNPTKIKELTWSVEFEKLLFVDADVLSWGSETGTCHTVAETFWLAEFCRTGLAERAGNSGGARTDVPPLLEETKPPGKMTYVKLRA